MQRRLHYRQRYVAGSGAYVAGSRDDCGDIKTHAAEMTPEVNIDSDGYVAFSGDLIHHRQRRLHLDTYIERNGEK